MIEMGVVRSPQDSDMGDMLAAVKAAEADEHGNIQLVLGISSTKVPRIFGVDMMLIERRDNDMTVSVNRSALVDAITATQKACVGEINARRQD